MHSILVQWWSNPVLSWWDTETCVGSSLASYFVLFSLISLVSFYLVSISLVSFRFVSFLLVSFRFVSFRFVSFSLISFRFYFVSHFIGTPVPVSNVTFMILSNRVILVFYHSSNGRTNRRTNRRLQRRWVQVWHYWWMFYFFLEMWRYSGLFWWIRWIRLSGYVM